MLSPAAVRSRVSLICFARVALLAAAVPLAAGIGCGRAAAPKAGSAGASAPSDAEPTAEEVASARAEFDRLGLPVVLDQALGARRTVAVERAYLRLAQLSLAPDPTGWFDRVFGGAGVPAVVDYLNLRARIYTSTDPSAGGRVTPIARAPDGRPIFLLADNLGGILWLAHELALPQKRLAFAVNGVGYEPADPRVGVIRIQGAFPRLSPLEAAKTLVHEARHSDCTGGADAGDLAPTLRYVLRQSPALPANPACLHLHVVCPAGHDYQGEVACDGHAWGAYAYSWIFAAALERRCPDCSERERAVARMQAIDQYRRILHPEELARTLPDLSSQGVRRP